jgi:hypothetical protein
MKKISPLLTTLRSLKDIFLANLGRCPKCMKQSFIFMLGAWVLAFVIELTTNSPTLLIASKIVAVGSAGLWLLHLTAFSLRAVRNTSTSTGNALRVNAVTDLSLQSRRQFALSFAKSLIIAATATALPIRNAFAESRMSKCLTCCDTKLSVCGNTGACNILYQNCVANCNSQGETPSGWRCW